MSAELGPVAELLAEMIPRAAKAAHRRFPLIEIKDFEQEMWTAALIKAGHLNHIHATEENREGIVWEELRRVASAYGFDDDRDRRARKAKAAGYHTVDEDFYSRKVVATAIEVLIEAEWEPSTAVEQSTQATDNAGIRPGSSSAENATEAYLAVLVDVCRAFKQLKPDQQRTLTDWYAFGDDTEESEMKWARQRKAASIGITYDTFQHRKLRALDGIVKQLGGRSPWMRRKPRTAANLTA